MIKDDHSRVGIDVSNESDYRVTMSSKGILFTDMELYTVPVRSMSFCFEPAIKYRES